MASTPKSLGLDVRNKRRNRRGSLAKAERIRTGESVEIVQGKDRSRVCLLNDVLLDSEECHQ